MHLPLLRVDLYGSRCSEIPALQRGRVVLSALRKYRERNQAKMKTLHQISLELRVLCDDLRAHRELSPTAQHSEELQRLETDLWDAQRRAFALIRYCDPKPGGHLAGHDYVPSFPVCGE